MKRECGCRCHGGCVEEECCPECEPEAYVVCAVCWCAEYEHRETERHPQACRMFVARTL